MTLAGKLPEILTSRGVPIEAVANFEYLGFLIDRELSFKAHITKLVSKLRVKV